jgi:hypothetical protein
MYSYCFCIFLAWCSLVFLDLYSSVYCYYFFLQYWGLNSEPTPRATPPALFFWRVFWDRVLWTICLVGFKWWSPYLCLLSSWDYRCEPLVPGYIINFEKFSALITSNVSSVFSLFFLLAFSFAYVILFWNCPAVLGCSGLFQFLHFNLGNFYWPVFKLTISSAMSSLLISTHKHLSFLLQLYSNFLFIIS